MLSFQNDYQEGAHEKILKRLMETNLEPQSGYGSDSYTESAKEKIRKVCECPQADVWFLTGGTQTNHCVNIARSSSLLGPYEPCPRNPVVTNRNLRLINQLGVAR